MEKYDYLKAVKEDVKGYINCEIDPAQFEDLDALREYLNDELFCYDGVTGNGSGSYTFNYYKAEEYICHNWDLLAEALEAFGDDTSILKKGPEACDVTIRCYLLSRAIDEVLSEKSWENFEEFQKHGFSCDGDWEDEEE